MNALTLLLPALLMVTLVYLRFFHAAQQIVEFAVHTSGGLTFSYEVISSEMAVEWTGGGDFDPRDKCPEDFFAAGFTVLCKKLKDGGHFKFLYHKGKKLLYRIDKDVIRNKTSIGLHWVENTRFGSKYRIADPVFKGGKTLQVPNAKGGRDPMVFQYGEAVSPKRVQRRRELFRETHIQPRQCPEWWDIFNFIP